MAPLVWQNLLHVGLTLTACALLLALLHLQERAVGRYLAHHLGWNSVLVTGWLGVPLHELSHLFMARLFAHRIIAWKLFDPDPVSGTLGYVRHAYSRRSAYQLVGSFFIGVAPLLGGGLALAGLMYWMLLPGERRTVLEHSLALMALARPLEALTGLQSLLVALLSAIWTSRTIMLPLQLYLAICVASHMSPSGADMRGALASGLLLSCLAAMGAALAGHLGAGLAGIEIAPVVLSLLVLLTGIFQGCYATVVGLVCRQRRSLGRSIGHSP